MEQEYQENKAYIRQLITKELEVQQGVHRTIYRLRAFILMGIIIGILNIPLILFSIHRIRESERLTKESELVGKENRELNVQMLRFLRAHDSLARAFTSRFNQPGDTAQLHKK